MMKKNAIFIFFLVYFTFVIHICFPDIAVSHDREKYGLEFLGRFDATFSGRWSCAVEYFSGYIWRNGNTKQEALESAKEYAKGWYIDHSTDTMSGTKHEGYRQARFFPDSCHSHKTIGDYFIDFWRGNEKLYKLQTCYEDPSCVLSADELWHLKNNKGKYVK